MLGLRTNRILILCIIFIYFNFKIFAPIIYLMKLNMPNLRETALLYCEYSTNTYVTLYIIYYYYFTS